MFEPKNKIFDNFQRSVPYFTEMHFSQIFKPSSTFKIAQFEANFHAMTVSTSNCWTVNKKLLTRAVKTEAIENFGKENVRKTAIFWIKHFILKSSFSLRPIVLYMVGKLVK